MLHLIGKTPFPTPVAIVRLNDPRFSHGQDGDRTKKENPSGPYRALRCNNKSSSLYPFNQTFALCKNTSASYTPL